jgi:hypothetical protein
MGQPRECSHNASSGDLLQATSTGLAIRHGGNNGPSIFTNGVEHWALGEGRLLFWTGLSVDPPTDAQAVPDGATRPASAGSYPAATTDETAVVSGTDGTGVVLRASPTDDDWTPRGFMDGTQVTILERLGSAWARVRGDNGQEGWVPSRYLTR